MSLTHHKIAATFCDRKRSLRSSGLVALIGVISAGMLLQGPAAGADLDPAWRVAVIAQSVASLSAAVYALWRLLTVAARRFRVVGRGEVTFQPGDFEHQRAPAAARDATTINRAIHVGALALVLQVAAITVWWAVPAPTKTPPAYLSVNSAGQTVCGELLSADKACVQIKVSGERDPRLVALRDIANMRIVDEC